MRLGILGSRGIPNRHGGFEQFAEFFAVYAQAQGHEVYVYNSKNHPYKESEYRGVKLIHCSDPEDKIGTIGQFIYDFNCIRDARKREFDVLLQLGYTSSSIWGWYLPKRTVIVTNMDGLEWKRSKYSKKVQKFLKRAEKWAINTSDYLISDSIGIQDYISKKHNVISEYIAYGANTFLPNDDSFVNANKLSANNYFILIARMEPENNIEMILDGYVKSNSKYPFCVIGNFDSTMFGKYLKEKYCKNDGILFLGGIYDLIYLDHLRYYSRLYFHGHSVGGTNPSLLEAMGAEALVVAHNNEFNRAILNEDAFYFDSSDEVANLIDSKNKKDYATKIDSNIHKIKTEFNWNTINKKYLNFLIKCYNEFQK